MSISDTSRVRTTDTTSVERTLFISRAGADAGLAAEIGEVLEAHGYTVILQQWDFPNSNFVDRMHRSLANGVRVVALLSLDYLCSDYCSAEWENVLAQGHDPLNQKGRLILLRVGECDPPGLLAGLAYWDLVPILTDRKLLADVVREAVLEDHHHTTPVTGQYWRAPRPITDDKIRHTPNFTGRETELALLAGELSKGSPVVVHGLGGSGKSVLAREYAWRKREHYAVVWWLRAQTENGIIDDLVRLGAVLMRGLDAAKDRRAAAKRVTSTLLTGFAKPVLLIFDNLEDEKLLAAWNRDIRTQVLVTSRTAAWGDDVRKIPLSPWGLNEAIDYLLHESGRADLIGRDAQAIAEKLGFLPLALSHAAAYLKRTKPATARSYLERIEEHLAKVPKGAEYPEAVFATFQEAINTAEIIGAEKEEPLGAAAVLCLGSFFAPEAIPEELFQQEMTLYAEEIRPALRNTATRALDLRSTVVAPQQLETALGALDELSLIDFSTGTRTFTVHRLVQAAARDLLAGADLAWRQTAVAVANAAFPKVEFETWSTCDRLLPHALAALNALADDVGFAPAARLATLCGSYLSERGAFDQAERLFQRALEGSAEAEPLHGLANIYYRQGKYELAESFHERALHIRKQALGAEHPDVARTLNGLADLYYQQWRYAPAEPLFKEALRIWEQVKTGQPDVAYPLTGLALLYREQGKYQQAAPLYQRALRIRRHALTDENPLVAASLNGLAKLYYLQGKYNEAETSYRQAQRIWEKALGDEHPDVAYPRNGLALLYCRQWKCDQAELLFQDAQRIWEKAFGAEHCEVARVLNGLADLYREQGKYNQAEPLYQRALQIWERTAKPEHLLEHPFMAFPVDGLARLYGCQGRNTEAEPLFRRALAIREQALGPDHPDVATSLNGLAELYHDQREYPQAEPLFQRALVIREQALGPDHPDVATSLNGLAKVYRDQRRYAEAEPLFQRALAIREQALGPDHPDVAASLNGLATLYRDQRAYTEAEPL